MRSPPLRAFSLPGIVLAWGLTSLGADLPVEDLRYLTLRDGTVLRADLSGVPNIPISSDRPPLPISKVNYLAISPTPPRERILEIRRLSKGSSSPDFIHREKAARQLREIASGFETLIAEIARSSVDAEVRHRVSSIVGRIPPPASYERAFSGYKGGYDIAGVSEGGGRVISGDIGDWSATVHIRGHALKISRQNLAYLSLVRPGSFAFNLTGHRQEITNFSRLRVDADDTLPAGVIRTGFETDPAGRALNPGEDISDRFSEIGFHISTSVPGAMVSVNDFVVNGRSKGLSAATHAPLWEGTLTVRFHAPGRPKAPAFVTSAGLWVASVSPGGTALEAYDATGELIGSVPTERSGHEFLAFQSPVPVAEIRIVPKPEIDRNYTIDDLFFSPPRPFRIEEKDGWHIIETKAKEILRARSVIPGSDSFRLHELSFGVPKLSIDTGEITTITFAGTAHTTTDTKPADTHCLYLTNRCVIYATRSGYPEHRWAAFPDIPVPKSAIAGIWGLPKPVTLIPGEKDVAFLKTPDTALIRPPEGDWIKAANISLEKRWIASPDPLPAGTFYETSPLVWLGFGKGRESLFESAESLGSIKMASGDVLHFFPPRKDASQSPTVSLKKIGADAIGIDFFGQDVSIPLRLVKRLTLVRSP